VAKLNPPAAEKTSPQLAAGRSNYSINFNLLATIFSFWQLFFHSPKAIEIFGFHPESQKNIW
jgi:hypothetical protein